MRAAVGESASETNHGTVRLYLVFWIVFSAVVLPKKQTVWQTQPDARNGAQAEGIYDSLVSRLALGVARPGKRDDSKGVAKDVPPVAVHCATPFVTHVLDPHSR